MFANNNLGITNMGFPDTCLTPTPTPTPVTYPNVATSVSHIPAQFCVLFTCGLAENLATTGTVSNGDDAGVNTGVTSATLVGPDRSILGSFVTFISAMPASRLTSVSIQNSTNSPGVTLTPAQFVNLLLG